MPKRYAAKRRNRKTRRYPRKGRRVTSQLYRLKRQVRALRPELKYSDYTQVANNNGNYGAPSITQQDISLMAAGTSAPKVFLLNGVSPGTDMNTRVGWKVNNKFLSIKFKLALSDAIASDAEARARTRLIMVMDRNHSTEFSATVPQLSDILDSASFTATNDAAITSHYEPTIRAQWSVLFDKVYSYSSIKGNWINSTIKKKLHSMSLYHANTAQGSNASSLGRGAIYLFAVTCIDTDEGSPAAVDCSMDLTSRFYYTDV